MIRAYLILNQDYLRCTGSLGTSPPDFCGFEPLQTPSSGSVVSERSNFCTRSSTSSYLSKSVTSTPTSSNSTINTMSSKSPSPSPQPVSSGISSTSRSATCSVTNGTSSSGSPQVRRTIYTCKQKDGDRKKRLLSRSARNRLARRKPIFRRVNTTDDSSCSDQSALCTVTLLDPMCEEEEWSCATAKGCGLYFIP